MSTLTQAREIVVMNSPTKVPSPTLLWGRVRVGAYSHNALSRLAGILSQRERENIITRFFA